MTATYLRYGRGRSFNAEVAEKDYGRMPLTRAIPEAAEALDFPEEGEFAVALWTLLSSNAVKYTIYNKNGAICNAGGCAAIYRKSGYIPFCGYPLSRSGKFRTLDRNQVNDVLRNSPILTETGD